VIVLALTKKTDYALIALSHMARASERVSSAREIADLYHLSGALLMNVLKMLTRKGLVRSIRGSKGGYALVDSPEEITLDRLIASVEGPLQLSRCLPRSGTNGASCDLAETCPIRSPVNRVQKKLKGFLGSITLAEIAVEWPEVAPAEAAATGVLE
jgi:Rrf2 family protein